MSYRSARRETADEHCDFCPDSQKMVEKMKQKVESNNNNNAAPKVDGPPSPEEVGRSTWTFLHTLAAAYPEHPDEETKRETWNLLRALGKVYPCRWCTDDWKEQIQKKPPPLSSRSDLEQWMCQQHNAVNEKLGKPSFDCSKVQERWGPKTKH